MTAEGPGVIIVFFFVCFFYCVVTEHTNTVDLCRFALARFSQKRQNEPQQNEMLQ